MATYVLSGSWEENPSRCTEEVRRLCPQCSLGGNVLPTVLRGGYGLNVCVCPKFPCRSLNVMVIRRWGLWESLDEVMRVGPLMVGVCVYVCVCV